MNALSKSTGSSRISAARDPSAVETDEQNIITAGSRLCTDRDNWIRLYSPWMCGSNSVRGRLKFTGHAVWIMSETESSMCVIVLSSRDKPKSGWSRRLLKAMIFVFCSGDMKRSLSVRVCSIASSGDSRRVRQYTVEIESSLSSSYSTWAPIDPVAPVKSLVMLASCSNLRQ